MAGRWARQFVGCSLDGGEDGVGFECRSFAPEPSGGAEQVTLIGERASSVPSDLVQPGQSGLAGGATAEAGDVEMGGEIGLIGCGGQRDPLEAGSAGGQHLIELGMITTGDPNECVGGGAADIRPTRHPLRRGPTAVTQRNLSGIGLPDHQRLEVPEPGDRRLGLDQQPIEVVGVA